MGDYKLRRCLLSVLDGIDSRLAIGPELFYIQQMVSSSTLHVGDTAPEFTLGAANRERSISLRQLLARAAQI